MTTRTSFILYMHRICLCPCQISHRDQHPLLYSFLPNFMAHLFIKSRDLFSFTGVDPASSMEFLNVIDDSASWLQYHHVATDAANFLLIYHGFNFFHFFGSQSCAAVSLVFSTMVATAAMVDWFENPRVFLPHTCCNLWDHAFRYSTQHDVVASELSEHCSFVV